MCLFSDGGLEKPPVGLVRMDGLVVATQILFNLSPRKLGKISNLTIIFFKGVGSNTNQMVIHLF